MVKKNTELDLTALEWINENHIMFLNERGLLNENLTDKVKRVKRNIKKILKHKIIKKNTGKSVFFLFF